MERIDDLVEVGEASYRRSAMKNKTNNIMTAALVWETSLYKDDHAIFTVNDENVILEDGRVLISLKKLYMECEDLGEHEFVSKYLYSWKQWLKMCENKFLSKYIEEWRTELRAKVRSEIILSAKDLMGQDNLQAAKFLYQVLNEGTEVADTKEKAKMGRPSNKAIDKAAREKLAQKSYEDSFFESALSNVEASVN